MIDPIDAYMPAPNHDVPDWARCLSTLNSSIVGEAIEERTHQEIALQMKLEALRTSHPSLASMVKTIVEFGATSACLVPSPTAMLNALGGYGLPDGGSWTIAISIPFTSDGLRLLGLIRRLCDLDEGLFPRWERDVPFSVSGLRREGGKVTFILTGYCEEATEQFRLGLDSLA